MTRVLIVHGDRRAPGQGGGAESLLRDQARGLKALGHEVSWWWGEGSIEQAVETFKPDIVHLMTLHCYPMGLQPAIWLQEQRIPHLWHLQDYWPFCEPRMLLVNGDQSCSAVRGVCQHECGRYAPPEYLQIVNRSFVVAGNGYTADIYHQNGLRCDGVVELGVDTELFKPDPSKRDGEVSIYTSSAWPDQPTKGMHIVREAIKGTGMTVSLITGVPREQVAEALKRAHIYVFPSCYEETFGLGLCEAMASGCAVITSGVAGARAQLHTSLVYGMKADDWAVMGMTVPPGDAKALREAIDWARDYPEECRAMGEAARTHVEQEHSLDAMARRWEAAYRRVLVREEVGAR